MKGTGTITFEIEDLKIDKPEEPKPPAKPTPPVIVPEPVPEIPEPVIPAPIDPPVIPPQPPIVVPAPIEPPVEPAPVQPVEPAPVQNMADIITLQYVGATRLIAGGESISDFATGTLAYNKDRNSVYMAGKAPDNAIAEFAWPELTLSYDAKEIPKATVIQSYVKMLDEYETNKITGMLYYKDKLIVNSEIWYNASADNGYNLLVANADNLKEKVGLMKLVGGAEAAGYMGDIPLDWQERLNGTHFTGWSSVYSITSRYSQGPSLHVFSPDEAITDRAGDFTQSTAWLNYPYDGNKVGGTQLSHRANDTNKDVDPLWNPNAAVMYSFILDDYFICLGRNAGIRSGIGYKITQDNGNLCHGYCPYEHDDKYPYFWIYDLNDIYSAENPHDPRPIYHGIFKIPVNGLPIGGEFIRDKNLLLINIEGAGKTGTYDYTPLTMAFKIGLL